MKPAALALALILTTYALAQADDAPCPGTVEIPMEYVGQFTPAEAPDLLKSAIGAPTTGSLCQGKVYEIAATGVPVTIYRAWNSTNPGSRLGKWWAFTRPNGKVAQYRTDYEICYQWSPLDKLTQCKLKPGTKLVVGTGQSATCSQYQTYPASAAKQIYLDSQLAVYDCKDYDLDFSWERVDK